MKYLSSYLMSIFHPLPAKSGGAGRQSMNMWQMSRYMIHEHHPAIVSREVFGAMNK